jgi:hypothetical protein
MLTTLFTLISALTALAAVFVGPFVSLRIARRQSSEAQINALQDNLSEVFTILTPVPPDEINAENLSRAKLLMNRIRLRLPEDESSEELLRVIRQLLEISSVMEREQALKRAFSKSHEILSGMRAGLLRRYKNRSGRRLRP